MTKKKSDLSIFPVREGILTTVSLFICVCAFILFGKNYPSAVIPIALAVSIVMGVLVYRTRNGMLRAEFKSEKVEEELRFSEERFRLLAEHSPVGIFQVNENMECQYINRHLLQILEAPQEFFRGKDWINLIHPEDRPQVLQAWQQAVQDKKEFQLEYRFQRNDGKVLWVSGLFVPLLDQEGNVLGHIGTVMDISLLKSHERELLAAKESAEITHRIQSEFLTNLSREMRTPLNAIIGFSELLRNTVLEKQQQNYLATIAIHSGHLLEIVNDVMDISRIEAGKILLERSAFHLDVLLEEVYKFIRPKLAGKPIDLYVDIAPDVPLLLEGDLVRIKQVLVNLLGNAVKFTAQGHIGLEIRLEEKDSQNSMCALKFSIKDTGIGISPAAVQKLFQPFARADIPMTREFGGTGLGLAICKSFVAMMRGEIWVDSELGKGSRFHFNLRLKFIDGDQSSQQSVNAVSQGQQAILSPRIVIFGDQRKSNESLMRACQECGMEVCSRLDSRNEIFYILSKIMSAKDRLPEFILIDLDSVSEEGCLLARKLKQSEHYRTIKLIAVGTGLLGVEDFFPRIFDGVLNKPILKTNLQKVVAGVLISI